MKTSTVLATSFFLLFSGTSLALVLAVADEKRQCDHAIAHQLKQVKQDPYSRLGDLSAACAQPTAHAVDRVIRTR